MDSNLKDCCGASDVSTTRYLNEEVLGARSGVPAGLKGRTHSRLDKGDADVDTTLHSWFEFPWMGELEYQGYLAFSSKSASSSTIVGLLLMVLPTIYFRCNLGNIAAFNSHWLVSSVFAAIFGACLLLQLYDVHSQKSNEALTRFLFLKNNMVSLQDIITITATITSGFNMLARVATGECRHDATLWETQDCNPSAAGGSIPPENLIFVYMVPFLCAAFVRGVSLRAGLGSFLLGMAFTAHALSTTGKLVQNSFSIVYGFFCMLIFLEFERIWRVAYRSIHAKMDLLSRVFPPRISKALLAGKAVQPTKHENVCVFFSDIVTFTELTDSIGADSTLDMVDAIYCVMDDLVDQFPGKLWKMETAGDAYMVECGAVYGGGSLAENCAAVLDFALLVQQRVSALFVPGVRDPIQLRIGVHCGSCTAGLVGSHKHMPHFSLFGNLINAASRVETTSSPGMIHVSDAVAQSIISWKSSRAKQYRKLLTFRGPVDLKGLGRMNTWWLTAPASIRASPFNSTDSLVSLNTQPETLQCRWGGSDVLSFGFDVRCVPTDVESLVEATFCIFARLFSLERLRVNPVTLKSFLRTVGRSYSNDVFYHNFHHAFSVTQFTAALYKQCVIDTTEIKTSLEMTMFASMIGVICHDAGHDGFNNTFHVNSKSPLAKTYFNQSPLEHHHTSVALSCLGTHGCNVFENWCQSFVDFARNLISNSLLATDMLLHDQVLQDLLSYDPSLLTSPLHNFSSSMDVVFRVEQYELLRLSRLMLHAADISNTVRPFAISAHYTDKLASEFGVHMARERELGLPVAPFMVIPDDQAKARGEIYFLTNIARPYFAALAKAFPACQELVSTLDENIKEWALVASS